MNVRLPQPRHRVLLFLLLIAFGAPRLVSAQVTALKNLATSVNTEVRDTISGIGLTVFKVSPAPQHGDIFVSPIQLGNGGPNVYKITYQPDAGFAGVDTFTVQYTYINNYPFLVYQGFRVSVLPMLLETHADYAQTSSGTPVTLDVLSNDTGNGTLSVSAIPLVNHGSAYIDGSNQIVFTPDPGFTGVAHLNYVACDAFNNCQTAYVSVGVHSAAPATDGTLQVATASGTELSVPLPYDGFALFQAPANGLVMLEDGGRAFRYTPAAGFAGNDVFVLVRDENGSSVYETVQIDVIPKSAPNKMAMNDRVFTPQGQAITFNVRDNDIGNLLVKSWVTPNGFPGVISGTGTTGQVTFTPNPGFTGVATFLYRIGNQQIPNLETAAVDVVVGNLPPAFPAFDLTTPVATPYVVNYRIPYTNFTFNVLEAPEHGACTYFPGFSTQTINGKEVSGHNLLIYTPENGYVGTDTFEVEYCMDANGQCNTVRINMDVADLNVSDAPYCVDDCVWAGDVNRDGIVNNKDLLPLGYFTGLEGPVRIDATLDWYGQAGDNWNNPYTGIPVDVKHADTDGSGAIDHADTLAIGAFYGRTSALLPALPPASKGLPFFLKVLTPNPQVGDLVRVEVSLGSDAVPVTDLYGFTFDVSLGSNIVDSALRMTYYDHSWLNLNAPTLWMGKNPRHGRLETAFTRTNGVSSSGYGVIGEFDFIIIDIIDVGKPGKYQPSPTITITIDNPSLLSGGGEMISGSSFNLDIPLGKKGLGRESVVVDDQLFVYPSPASDRLSIHLNGDDLIESLSVLDATGREVYVSGPVQSDHMELSIGHLSEGFYVASVRTRSGNVLKKFQVLR